MGIKLITTHSGADFDALASLLAAGKLYPGALMFLPGSPERKVRCYLENEIFPGKLIDFSEIKNKNMDLLVVVDTRYPGRIGRVKEILNEKTRIHLYDHHPRSENDMDGEINEMKKYGATTTMLVEKIRLKKIPLNPEEATLMAMGIYEDTGCLTYPMTCPRDLEAVSYLLSKGADLTRVAFYVTHTLKEEQVALLNTFLKNKHIIYLNGGKTAFLSARPEKYVEDLSVTVQKAAEILNPDALFALVELEGNVLCVMRSDGRKFNAGKILKKFSGGGHDTAASALFKDRGSEEVKKILLKYLRKSAREEQEFSIEKSPLRVIPEKDNVIQAYRAIIHMGWEYAPVGNEKGELRGIIEKEELEKAIKHGLSDQPAVQFIHTEIATVTSEDKEKIREKFYETGSPFVIIKKNDKVKGFASLSADPIKDIIPKKIDLEVKLKRLPGDVCKILHTVSALANEQGVNAFCVGGMVRDIILGIPHKDVDIVVDRNGAGFAGLLADRLGVRAHTHDKFNTAVIKMPEREIDIATLRKEHYLLPAALPDVKTGTLRQDLKRRDFTINAMAIQLTPSGSYARLIDFFGGKKDIEEGIIRVLYPLSFVEDPTRIFRAVRFKERFSFTVNPQTLSLIKKSIHMDMHLGLSPDRVKEEILNIMNEEKPHKIVKSLYSLGALNYIHEKMKITEKSLNMLKKLGGSGRHIAMITSLLAELPLQEGKKVLEKFNFSKKYIETYIQLKRKLPGIEEVLKKEIPHARVYTICNQLTEDFRFILLKTGPPKVRENICLYNEKLSKVKTAINGKKLIQMGYKPSPLISEIMNSLKPARLNGKVKTSGQEEKFVKKNFPLS